MLVGEGHIFLIALGLFGAVVGSFLTVVIHRLPIMMERQGHQAPGFGAPPVLAGRDPRAVRYDLVAPGSACPRCQAPIKPFHNVPIIGYLVLGGRCAACGGSISATYPLVEAASAALAVILGLRFGFGWQLALALVFSSTLISITVIDLKHMLIPDSLSLPLLWIGLLANAWGLFSDPANAIIAVAAGYGFSWLLAGTVRHAMGREGLGYGDFKLIAALGAWLGWRHLFVAFFLACVMGAGAGVALILARRLGKGRPIPFGPFLAVAGLVTLLWGDDLWRAYWALVAMS